MFRFFFMRALTIDTRYRKKHRHARTHTFIRSYRRIYDKSKMNFAFRNYQRPQSNKNNKNSSGSGCCCVSAAASPTTTKMTKTTKYKM